MCIAIYKPVGKSISDEVLERCYKKNQDGCGYAHIKTYDDGDKQLITYKDLVFESWLESYREAEAENADSPFLIHFRIKTHGKIDIDNCHPFIIDDDHVFIHNGIISGVPNDPNKSDTRMFKNHILSTLPEGWMGHQAIKTLLEDFIGYSKLVVMNRNGDVELYNEKKGEWFGGVWYSNTGYKAPAPAYTHGGHRGGNYNQGGYGGSTTYSPITWNPTLHRHERFNYGSYEREWRDKNYNWHPVIEDWEDWKNQSKAQSTDGKGKVLYLPNEQDNTARDTHPDQDIVDLDSSLTYDPEVFELKPEQIEALACGAGIPVTKMKFTLGLQGDDGVIEAVDFIRCEHCLEPEYSHLIYKYLIHDVASYCCEGCRSYYELNKVDVLSVEEDEEE